MRKKAKPQSLDDWLKKLKPRKFKPHLVIRPDTGTVEVALEDVACHHEWIKSEGSDISIWRAIDDNRIVGATLPLRNWNGEAFKVHIWKTL